MHDEAQPCFSGVQLCGVSVNRDRLLPQLALSTMHRKSCPVQLGMALVFAMISNIGGSMAP